MPVALLVPIRAETPIALSVMRSTWAPSEATWATLPTRPSPLMTGSLTRTPAASPLSMSTVEYQMFGDFADHRGGHRVVVADAELVEVVEREQLAVGAFFGLVGDQFAAQFVGLLEQLVALAFGVQRVAEPAEQVAHGLQRLVGAVLDRRDDRQEVALHAVQAPARRLAEVGGQQQQREHDEQHKHRSSTPDRLVVHR